MANVYIVTKGHCSDYTVIGIFSTREKAEQYINIVPGGRGFNDIEEVELDNMPAVCDKYPYCVTYTQYSVSCYPWDLKTDGADERVQFQTNSLSGVIDVYLYAENVESAKKLAAHRRAEFLAQHKLI